jgi:hypothetical protein
MALITRLTRCPLCGELPAGRRVVATSHFIADRADPLWRFRNAAMHHDCFQARPLRRAFVDKYNATVGPRVCGNGRREVMRPDGTIANVRVRR